ncbi:MAG: hypothetical protein IPM76_18605 [Chloroflexi bacterium]|nr:hypothetical protein [Chloroflexota bacterium]
MPDGENGRSQPLLEQPEAANTFLISLDDERRWYRYHHLFADLLRQNCRLPLPALPAAKRAAWSIANGLTADAIEYALAAEAWDTARAAAGRTWPLVRFPGQAQHAAALVR